MADTLCEYSLLALSGGTWPAGAFLGKCECGAVLVIETGSFPPHYPGVAPVFHEWLAEHDAETSRRIAAGIKSLHDGFGPSNVPENDYNAGAHAAIGRALDTIRES